MDIYEDQTILAEYLLFHYGTADETLTGEIGWPSGMVEALGFTRRTPGHFSNSRVARGLDLGCAVGRSAFEMARNCDEVIGLDYSHRFIEAANIIKKDGRLGYLRREEGKFTTDLTAAIPDGVDPDRVSFMQGDAMNLSENLGLFDRVHAANLLCRLTEPELFLNRLPSLVKPGGELVLATPCTWLEAFTPREKWPETDTLNWLKDKLSASFELRSESDEPFLIRETARKFQWTRSMLTVWVRR